MVASAARVSAAAAWPPLSSRLMRLGCRWGFLVCKEQAVLLGCRPRHAASSIQAAATAQVTAMAAGLKIPLTCKIRIYPELDRTVAYAQVRQ